MKDWKASDIFNMRHELNILKRRIAKYMKLTVNMSKELKRARLGAINGNTHIHFLEKKIEQLEKEISRLK